MFFLSDVNVSEFKRRYEKYLNDLDSNLGTNGFIRMAGEDIGLTRTMPTDLLRKAVNTDRLNITTNSYSPDVSRRRLRESLGGRSQKEAQDVLENKGTKQERIERQKKRLAQRQDIMRPNANPNNYSNVNVPKKPSTVKPELTNKPLPIKPKNVESATKLQKQPIKMPNGLKNKYLLSAGVGLGVGALAGGALYLRDRNNKRRK